MNSVAVIPPPPSRPLVDGLGRRVHYLRLSVTDRCDLRCVYCMKERMEFLPRKELLTLDEMDRLCAAFIARGVRKLRLTGGEPLVRRGLMDLVASLKRHLVSGALDEIALTTNATRLADFADGLAAAGVRRVNISLDTLDAALFTRLTRGGRLANTLEGITAAREAGLRVKINMVALKGLNETEIPEMMRWAHGLGMDLTLIETMPMGDTGIDRSAHYLPLSDVRAELAAGFTLTPQDTTTGGPARYVHIEETGGTLGFITPLSHNFCATCNRVRVSCTGQLYMCLGQEDYVDLRDALRTSPDNAAIDACLDTALARKAPGHDFVIPPAGEAQGVARHMSTTGG